MSYPEPTITYPTSHALTFRGTLRAEKEMHLSVAQTKAHWSRISEDIAHTYMTNALVGHVSPTVWSELEEQYRIIDGEYQELREALDNRDPTLLRDAVGDLMYTLIGLIYRANIPAAMDYEQIVRSNLTKFDLSVEEAQLTAEKYRALGITTYCQPVRLTTDARPATLYYVTFVDGTQQGSDGKTYPANKWLKSTRFVDINLPPLSATHPLMVTSKAYGAEQLAAAAERLTLPENTSLVEACEMLFAGLIYSANIVNTVVREDTPFLRDHVALIAKKMVRELWSLDLGDNEKQHLCHEDLDWIRSTVNRSATRASTGQPAGSLDLYFEIMEATLNTADPTFLGHMRNLGPLMGDDMAFLEGARTRVVDAVSHSMVSRPYDFGPDEFNAVVSDALKFLTHPRKTDHM